MLTTLANNRYSAWTLENHRGRTDQKTPEAKIWSDETWRACRFQMHLKEDGGVSTRQSSKETNGISK